MSNHQLHRDGLVQDVEVTHDGHSRRASYFVENGMIYMRSHSKSYLLPTTDAAPDDVVRQVLLGMVQTELRNADLAQVWDETLALTPREHE